MIKEKGFYRKFVKVGPGGIHCGCCFPQTNPGRKYLFRVSSRDEKRLIERLIKEELK